MPTKHPSLTDFAHGTVLTEADVEVVKAQFAMFDYQGTRDAIPALVVSFKTADGNVYDQGYSVGSADDFAPSKDGRTLDILTEREKIHEQTNYAHFMEALFKAGFPRNRIDNANIGCVVGTCGHVKQETVKRTGANIKAETSLLVFERVTTLPGEGTTASGGGDDAATGFASDILLEVLSEAGTIERKKLLPKVIALASFKALDKDLRTAVLNTVKSDDFILNSTDWTVDKTGIVSIGG